MRRVYKRNDKQKYWWTFGSEKVSRKTKKSFIGTKMTKKDLKARLNVVIATPVDRGAPDLSDIFCPFCGCDHSRSTGNMVDHPEVYIKSYCLRCNALVGMADNSYFYHALHYKEFGYQID